MFEIRIKYLQIITLFRLITYFLCHRLLGEFLLPSSNILPRTYQDLNAIMKEIGMEYKAINACPNYHIIYYGQHASKIECAQC
jgi:hypothetical protein